MAGIDVESTLSPSGENKAPAAKTAKTNKAKAKAKKTLDDPTILVATTEGAPPTHSFVAGNDVESRPSPYGQA